LTLVHLQTFHRQTVYRLTQLHAEEQQLRREIQHQEVEISACLQSPPRVKDMVARLGLELYAPGEEPAAATVVAGTADRNSRNRN
jgi:hypothetical protein